MAIAMSTLGTMRSIRSLIGLPVSYRSRARVSWFRIETQSSAPGMVLFVEAGGGVAGTCGIRIPAYAMAMLRSGLAKQQTGQRYGGHDSLRVDSRRKERRRPPTIDEAATSR
jgi:hypothetical protein